MTDAGPLVDAAVSCDWESQEDFGAIPPVHESEPVIEVLEPGRAPRVVRQYRFRAGTAGNLGARAEQRMKMTPVTKGLGRGWSELPTYEYGVAFEVAEVDPDGNARLEFTVASVELDGVAKLGDGAVGSDGKPGDPKQLSRELLASQKTELEGHTLSLLVTPSGGRDVLTGGHKFAEPIYLVVPWPGEPVGVGAVWRFEGGVVGGTTFQSSVRGELLEADESGARVRFEVEGGLKSLRQMNEDGIPQEFSYDLRMRGEVEVRWSGVPVAGDWLAEYHSVLVTCSDRVLSRFVTLSKARWRWTSY